MKKLLMCVLVLSGIILFTMSGISNATVLTFDDLSGDHVPIPNGYGGLNWTNMWYLDSTIYPVPSGYQNGTVSGTNVAFNAWDTTAYVTDGVFDFNGAYLTAAWNDGLSINVVGYNNSIELYNMTVQVDTTGPALFNFNFIGIDELKFDSYGGVPHGYQGGGEHFAMDNFTFNEAQSVPEPATILLLGTGLISLAGLGRRFRVF